MSLLGLFPLRIVLFPGSSYPLHIFEERYKTLIGEALRDETEFGINLVHDGRIYQVGCRARVTNLLSTYEDGTMDIIVTGTERFSVDDYDLHSSSYITAEARPYDDTDPLPSMELLNETVDLYNTLVETVYGEAEATLEALDWRYGGGAFRMAQKSGLDLPLRQKLLETRSENERLESLKSYFETVLPTIQKVEFLQTLVRNDGYIAPDNGS